MVCRGLQRQRNDLKVCRGLQRQNNDCKWCLEDYKGNTMIANGVQRTTKATK